VRSPLGCLHAHNRRAKRHPASFRAEGTALLTLIDGRALTGRFTGDRTYWRNLLQALPDAGPGDLFVVASRIPVDPAEQIASPNVRYVTAPAPNDRIWTLRNLPAIARAERADLIHVQYTAPPRFLCPCPIVTTVHDISFKLYPQWFPRRDRILLNLTVPISMRAAARVITVSESSREDIIKTYWIAPDKVVGIRHGVPLEFVKELERGRGADLQETARLQVNQQFSLNRPYILAVGVLQPRKNLRALAEAFGKMKSRTALPHLLVLAGKTGWGTEEAILRECASRFGGASAAEDVVLPGYIPDDALPALYRASSVFAYPSLYEGFGLPPLEAMACGVPVLSSNRPAMPEVVGDAALTVDPGDTDAWAEALARILTDEALREKLIAAGGVRAHAFTWADTAERTMAVYREARASGR
jgi:glycosyltransferase involved in cell wall biosynthesis